MTTSRALSIVAGLATIASLAIMPTGTASAGEEPDGGTAPGVLAAPEAAVIDLAGLDQSKPIPSELLTLVTQRGYEPYAAQSVSTRWIAAEGVIEIFAAGDLGQISESIKRSPMAERLTLRGAPHTLADLRAARELLFRASPSVNGLKVFGAAPSSDGPELRVMVEEPPAGARIDLARAEAGIEAAISVPVSIELSAIPISAARYGDSSPFSGGSYMSNSQSRSCTFEFTIGTLNAPNPQILSADHWSAPTGTSWWSGNTRTTPNYLGYGQGQAPGGSDLERIEGTSNALSAYVDVGAYTANTVTPIRGWTNPVLGASVCYSGAPSGTVCNNTITQTNEYICDLNDPGAPCYAFLNRTVQPSGIAAAGNGDSGGPVIQPGGGGVYATGIVSGMINAGTSCTGRPSTDTRKCSTTALYAPVSNFFYNNTNYGIYIALPSGT